MTKIIDFKLKLLTQINFEQFKLFLDSLDEERKTWSLDLQSFKNREEFYNSQKSVSLVCLFDEKIIGLIYWFKVHDDSQKIFTDEFKYFNTVKFSCVVKKEFHGMGVGTKLLLEQEKVCLRLGYDSVVGITSNTNYAAHRYMEKAGWTMVGERLDEYTFGKDQILILKKFKEDINE